MWKESQQETRDLWLSHADVVTNFVLFFSENILIIDLRLFRRKRKIIYNVILNTSTNQNVMVKKVQDWVEVQVHLEKHHFVKHVVAKQTFILHQTPLSLPTHHLHLSHL